MRVTTQMMNGNLMGNISSNKDSLYKLQEQYSTGKKIQRPSDDPIVAVRSLKLRTNISEMEQYLEKNIPDAMSWMDVTESAMKSMNDVMQYMYSDVVKGANDTLTSDDREMILKNLTQLRTQIYQEGNANYAGRYVFTGYRTDESMTYQKDDSNKTFTITQDFTKKDIEVVNKVYREYDGTEDQVKQKELYRIQLGYDNLDVGDITFKVGEDKIIYKERFSTDENVRDIDADEIVYLLDIKEIINGSNILSKSNIPDIKIKNSTDKNVYDIGDNEVIYLFDTGEILMGKNVYENITDEKNISVEYKKTNFKAGDVKPQHYFNCTDGEKFYELKEQNINYEVNFSQDMRINSQISDVLSINLGRCIDDITNALNDVATVEKSIDDITKELENTDDETKREELELEKEKLSIELAMKNDILTESFEKGLDKLGDYQQDITVGLADLGSRYSRLQLIESRLDTQMTDYTELLSTNEDVDIVDTYINYSSMNAIYEASLSVASKINQNSLLDFI